jgi:hypothetical protein
MISKMQGAVREPVIASGRLAGDDAALSLGNRKLVVTAKTA